MKFDQDLWNCDMTSRSYFGKMNSTLGSIVPLAMFILAALVLAKSQKEEEISRPIGIF